MTFTRTNRRSGRRGLTLFELLLVLAIIVLIAGVSVPYFEGWFAGHRLNEGVDTLREHWIKARTLAMEEGRPYRFAYLLNGQSYRLAPDDIEHWEELAGTSAGPQQSGVGFPPGMLVEAELPEAVYFYNLEGVQKGQPLIGGWAKESIVFWPSGEARLHGPDGEERAETQVLLTDRSSRLKGLHIRALTGVVSVQIVDSMGIAR
jgi:prepilin-type N-terminal cleavage/methylation domain-containing protein